MKKLSCLMSAVLMLTTVSSSFAKGIIVSPTAKANAMGAAVVSTVNDASSVYWNPAGLAKVKKNDIQAGLTYVSGDAKSSVAPANATGSGMGDFPLPNMNNMAAFGEPASYESKKLETTATLPFLAGAFPLNNGIVLAVSLYGVGGGGGKWKDSVSAGGGLSTIDASLDALTTYSVYNVSAAKEVAKGLCIGIGIDMVNVTDYLKIKKDYTCLNTAFNYGMLLKSDSSGYGMQFTGGILYAVKPNVNLGLVARSGTEISASGTATFDTSGSIVASSFETSYDQKFTYPMTVCLGLSYDPSEKWTVAASAEQISYSSMKNNKTYKTQNAGAGFVDSNSSAKWKDTVEMHLGGQYRLDDKWTFGAGYQTTPNTHDYSGLSLFDTNQYDLSFFDLGAQYRIDNWSFALSYDYPLSSKMTQNGVSFEYPVTLTRLDIGYQF